MLARLLPGRGRGGSMGKSKLLTFVTMVAAGCGPAMRDISPNVPAGALSSSAGLTLGFAGDNDELYAVSLNAGIWKSVDGGRWAQLQKSPRYAHAIAADPRARGHLVVGERNGDARERRLNQAGVWESTDGGASWTYVLDPLSNTSCTSQAVADVAFSPDSAARSAGRVRPSPLVRTALRARRLRRRRSGRPCTTTSGTCTRTCGRARSGCRPTAASIGTRARRGRRWRTDFTRTTRTASMSRSDLQCASATRPRTTTRGMAPPTARRGPSLDAAATRPGPTATRRTAGGC